MYFHTLPDEIKLEILKYLDTNTTSKFGMSSSIDKSIAQNNTLWKYYIQRDFYLSEAAINELLQSQQLLNNNYPYKMLYKHIQGSRLNRYQIEAFRKFKDKGLTLNHLRGRDWFDETIYIKALSVIMSDSTLMISATEAIDRFRTLKEFQLRAIVYNNFDLNLVSKINMKQYFTFLNLKESGFTLEVLAHNLWLSTEPQLKTLEFLMKDRDGLSAEEAIDLIKKNQHNESALYAIQNNLFIGLCENLNAFQIKAIGKIGAEKLKRDNLIDKKWFNSELHINALNFLMVKRQPTMDAETALNNLKGANRNELYGISKGLSKDQMEGLTRYQIEMLIRYKKTSICDFRLNRSSTDRTEEFKNFLSIILRAYEKGLTIKEDIKEDIDKLRSLTVIEYYALNYYDFSKDKVKGLTNLIQVDALSELFWYGLTKNHLQGHDYFKTRTHIFALFVLISLGDKAYKQSVLRSNLKDDSIRMCSLYTYNNRLSIEEAMEKLKDTTEEEARAIIEGHHLYAELGLNEYSGEVYAYCKSIEDKNFIKKHSDKLRSDEQVLLLKKLLRIHYHFGKSFIEEILNADLKSYQIKVILDYKILFYNLTSESMNEIKGCILTKDHREALKNLLAAEYPNDYKLSLEEAFKILNELKPGQIRNLADGLTLKEVSIEHFNALKITWSNSCSIV